MNKILKSLVSGFTSLSMCAVCMISIPATADEYENIETQATNFVCRFYGQRFYTN